ncbi:MAG: sulfatase [Deltaproteobacteria bacterium]|nr:sulfatase [Deltaproteobacteria bacterium]
MSSNFETAKILVGMTVGAHSRTETGANTLGRWAHPIHEVASALRPRLNRASSGLSGTLLRLVLALLPLVLLSACSDPPPADPMLPAPVVILDIDTLRADHLGCYGYRRPTSPRIDALANESFLFQWAFSQAHSTGPSQGSIFTGLYPTTHSLVYNGARLPDSVTTLAEHFSDAGFKTAAFVDGGFMDPIFGLDQGFQHYETHDWKGLDTIGPRVIDWLRRNAEENFLLLVHTYDVHADYTPPEPFRSLFTEGITPTPGFEPTVKQLEVIRKSQARDQALQLPAADLAFAEARYDGGIRFVDYWVGRILDELQALGLDRRATIILLSDHGEAFQEHGTVEHDRLYAPVTHIPLLIRPPGGTQGKVVESVVQAMDIMPTLLEGAGLQVPTNLQGRSLLPFLRGEPPREMPAFSESPYFGHRRAIAWGDHHLIGALESDHIELFNFRLDPLELEELSAENPQVVSELYDVAKRWQDSLNLRGAPETEVPSLDDEKVKSLQALGYLN